MSIAERCDKSIRHSSLVWQTGAIVDRRHTRHTAVWSSAKPIASLDNTNEHLLHLHIVKLDVVTNSATRWPKKMSSNQTDSNSSLLFNSLQLSSSHFASTLFASIRRTNNNKHNDTVNLHAQNCCTQNSKNQTRPKISQNVYRSKRNLVANNVYVSHIEFTIADQLMVGQ